MARAKHIGGDRRFHLYPQQQPDAPVRVLRCVTFGEGEARVAKGIARRVYDGIGNLLGYQVCEPKADTVSSDKSSATISRGELHRNAFALAGFRDARSRTIHLSEEAKTDRETRGFAAEDAAELAIRKVQVYPEFWGRGSWEGTKQRAQRAKLRRREERERRARLPQPTNRVAQGK